MRKVCSFSMDNDDRKQQIMMKNLSNIPSKHDMKQNAPWTIKQILDSIDMNDEEYNNMDQGINDSNNAQHHLFQNPISNYYHAINQQQPFVIQFTPKPQNMINNKTWRIYDELKQSFYDDKLKVFQGSYYININNMNQMPYDLLLKVSHQKQNDDKTYYRIYFVHRQYMVNHCGTFLVAMQQKPNESKIAISIDDELVAAFEHMMVYIYTQCYNISPIELIPLFTLCRRFQIYGNIVNELLSHIRFYYQMNTDLALKYLLQCYSVENEDIKHEISQFILKKIKKREIKHICLYHKLSTSQITDLFIKSCQYKEFNQIGYEMIIQYLLNFNQWSARKYLQKLIERRDFNADDCNLRQCSQFIKIMETVFGENKSCSFDFYKKCKSKMGSIVI